MLKKSRIHIKTKAAFPPYTIHSVPKCEETETLKLLGENSETACTTLGEENHPK